MGDAATAPEGPIRLKATYKNAEASLEELTHNLSRGSTILESKRSLPKGTEFIFEIESPDFPETLEVQGIVVDVIEHTASGDGPRYSLKIEYRFDDVAHRDRITAMVWHLFQKGQYDVGREHVRIPTAYRVSLPDNPLGTDLVVRNLSSGGLLLEGPAGGPEVRGFENGKVIAFEVMVGGKSVEVEGEVMWKKGGSEAADGYVQFGVRFVNLSEASKRIMKGLMLHRFAPDSWTLLRR